MIFTEEFKEKLDYFQYVHTMKKETGKTKIYSHI